LTSAWPSAPSPDGDSKSDQGGRATGFRAFVLSDIRGYSSFAAAHGDEAAAELTARFIAVAERVIGEFGGESLGNRGDEVLFPARSLASLEAHQPARLRQRHGRRKPRDADQRRPPHHRSFPPSCPRRRTLQLPDHSTSALGWLRTAESSTRSGQRETAALKRRERCPSPPVVLLLREGMRRRSSGDMLGDLGAEREHRQRPLLLLGDEHLAMDGERPARRGGCRSKVLVSA